MAKVKHFVEVNATIRVPVSLVESEAVNEKIAKAVSSQIKNFVKESVASINVDVKASKKDGGNVSIVDAKGKLLDFDYTYE